MEQNIVFHNRYTLKKLIGRGAFAEVWLAEDNYTKIDVALKIFIPLQDIGDYGKRLLSSEFAVVANLRHENLLRPIHYDNCDNKPYLVLPYCKHGSCVKLIGKLSEYEAWNLLRDVASGLAYLHSHKPNPIIHQDIKPDNILIGPNGHYMLSDFGVSDQTLLSANNDAYGDQVDLGMGMCSYKGPEYFAKEKVIIKASDIYSLGITMFELLSGDVPFGELGGLMQVHGCEIPRLPWNCGEEMNYVVSACLNKDPWLRPTAETLEQWARTRGADIPQFAQTQGNETQDISSLYKTEDNKYDPYHNNSKPKHRKGLIATITICAIIAASIIILSLTKCEKESSTSPDIFPLDYLDSFETQAMDTVAKRTNSKKKHQTKDYDNEPVQYNENDYDKDINTPNTGKKTSIIIGNRKEGYNTNDEIKKTRTLNRYGEIEDEKRERDSVIEANH